jgi:hypothetical protein
LERQSEHSDPLTAKPTGVDEDPAGAGDLRIYRSIDIVGAVVEIAVERVEGPWDRCA